MTFLVRQTSHLSVPADVKLARQAPRPAGERQPDYVEKFDYKTLFYDIFESGNSIIFSGPPLSNLQPIVKVAKYTTFGVDRTDVPDTNYAWKTQRTSLPSRKPINSDNCDRGIRISAGHIDYVSEIQPDDNVIFDSRKVIFTLSKNNDLAWIKNWAQFYHSAHGVDAVLFYDNGSDAYSCDDILETLKSVEGIKSAVVVNWPFKYGPAGTTSKNWDSDFCQYGAIEHARLRFLKHARGVVNADIDELVMSDDDSTIFDRLDKSHSGAISYAGRWIENISASTGVPLHQDFLYFDPNRALCTKKWAVDPARVPKDAQWNVHSFGNGFVPDSPEGIFHRHFVGVNSNWKTDRNTRIELDPQVHKTDQILLKSMRTIFGIDNPETVL